MKLSALLGTGAWRGPSFGLPSTAFLSPHRRGWWVGRAAAALALLALGVSWAQPQPPVYWEYNGELVPQLPLPSPAAGDPCAMTQFIQPPTPGVPFVPPPGMIVVDPPQVGPGLSLDDYYRWITLIHAGHGAPAPMPIGHDYRSCCWHQLLREFPETPGHWWLHLPGGVPPAPPGPGHNVVPAGFGLGFNQLATPAIGDFLPAAATVGASALPLLPPGAGGLSTGWQRSHRPVLDGTVDLITGLPLLQVTDLELPFGGATFRLTRTRSGVHPLDGVSHDLSVESSSAAVNAYNIPAADHWWDWVGSGWMAGENPILLIDSAVPDLVGPHPRTTWLVLDAHHAIPFQQVNLAVAQPSGDPRVGYEAPPRFRARMKHNGTWGLVDGPDIDENPQQPDAEVYGWVHPPTQYEVWLYDGLVRYTFVAVRDDVPPKIYNTNAPEPANPTVPPLPVIPNDPVYGGTWNHTSYHDIANYYHANANHNPFDDMQNPGFGMPYFGLCTRIEDRNGHTVEISYCRGTRDQIDDTQSTPDCVECQQHCLRKGQISHVQLKTHDGVVVWTLVYAHRYFKPQFPPGVSSHLPWLQSGGGTADTPALLGTAAIDRIYAYEGDLFAPPSTLNPSTLCLQIPASDNPYLENPVPIDPGAGLPPDWVYQVRYWYRPIEWDPTSPGGGPSENHGKMIAAAPLMWTTVTSRRQSAENGPGIPGTETERHTFFRYHDPDQGRFNAPLGRIFTHEDYRRLIAWGEQVRGQEDPPPPWEDDAVADWLIGMTPLKFAVADISSDPPKESAWNGSGDARFERLAGFASLRLDSQEFLEWPPQATPSAPADDAVLEGPGGGYVEADVGRLKIDSDAEYQQLVGRASLRGSDGVPRHYRIFRFSVLPVGQSPAGGAFHVGHWGTLADYWLPHRSVFVHPYYWRTEAPNQGDEMVGAPDLTQSRWIVMIDEFAERESMVANVDYGSDNIAFKEGQVSRRVVQMNASGYVLRDKTWKFNDKGEIFASGGGLGETYEYRKIGGEDGVFETEVAALRQAIFEDIDPLEPGGYIDDDVQAKMADDQVRGLADQLLLVERRSVGWSAADMGETGAVEGLITFFEYHWYGVAAAAPEPGDLPWRHHIQLWGEGVQKGTGGDKYYTRQFFRDEGTPTDVEAEVEFLTAEAGAGPSGDPPLGSVGEASDPQQYKVTRWVTEREPANSEDPVPTTERKVLERRKIDPPRQLSPSTPPVWFYPVEMEAYNEEDGTTEWNAVGLIRFPDDLGPSYEGGEGESLILTYTKHYGYGPVMYTVADADSGDHNVVPPSTWAISQTIHVPEAPWPRISSADALEYVTYYEHDTYGPRDIYLPNGRRWARRMVTINAIPPTPPPPATPPEELDYIVEPGADPGADWTIHPEGAEQFARDFIFNDLERQSLSGGGFEWIARAAGEVRDYSGPEPIGQPVRTRRVEYTRFVSASTTLEEDAGISEDFLYWTQQREQPFFRPVLEKKLRPDQYGRLTDAELFERNVDGAWNPVGMKQVNDLGEVYRERDMDGTITRMIKNALGQPLRKYVGTIDDEWLIGFGGHIAQQANNNLVLVERYEIGAGPNDCWMPTITRRYTTNEGFPNDWHEYPWDDPDHLPPPADAKGQATWTKYDWRMRPVRVDVFATGDPATAPRLTTTLTFLDHAGRTRMVVTYGPGTLSLPTNGDPSLHEPLTPMPDPDEFLAGSGLKPLSLVGMKYGPGGEMTERRDYDVTSTANPPPYHGEFQYTGMGGNVVYRQRPGEGIEVNELDGLARVVETRTIVPRDGGGGGAVDYAYEAARTDYEYDPDNNVQQVHRWERVVGNLSFASGEEELGFGNAVRSSTLNWHDVQKRLQATAEFGTGWEDFRSTGAEPQYPQGMLVLQAGVAVNRPWIDPGALTVNRNGVPIDIPLTVYHYDRKGNQDYVAGPRASVATGGAFEGVTHFAYTGTNKVGLKVEDCFASAADQRKTEYVYRFGRLAEVLAKEDNGGSTPHQRTLLHYGAHPDFDGGADVIDTGLAETTSRAVSKHGGHMRSMFLLEGATGLPGPGPTLGLRYDFLGRLAERVDARGVAFRYAYDDLDRLSSVEVGHYADFMGGQWETFTPGYPGSMNALTGAPADRVGYVAYAYAPDLKTFEARAYMSKAAWQSAPDAPITHNKLEFDGRGRLSKDWQAQGAVITAATPKTGYAWDVEFSSGTGEGWPVGKARLSSMTYPTPPAALPGPARVVTFGYGAVPSPDDMLSRIASITTSPTSPGPAQVADFRYVGSSRRAQMNVANGAILQDLGLDEVSGGDGIGLHGLDQYGRLADLRWRHGPPATPGADLTRLKYTYDLEGNRETAERTPRPAQGLVANTRQEQENAYDVFNRLTGCAYTHVDEFAAETTLRDDGWQLDLLGNWMHRTMVATGSLTETVQHAVNHRNEIGTLTRQIGTGSPVQTDIRYDAAGNLLYDGQFAYQYDAWNRVVQINKAHLGTITPPQVEADEFVKHFTYDGLGRLIRVQSPYPNPEIGAVSNDRRSERFYYDGIRRIQEVLTDPVSDTEEAAMGGDPAALAALAANPDLDGDVATLSTENSQAQSSSGGGGPPAGSILEREYIWGPGDRGVDELLVQYDRYRVPTWPLQDAGLDVIALCDLGGAGGTARTVWQGTYDAYGAVLSAETLYPHAPLRAGHKGLFFDRLDLGIMDPYTGQETPRLAVSARLVGHVRHRALLPDLGRFAQRDPNATGAILLTSALQGRAMGAQVSVLDLDAHYGDGANVYGYLGSSPWGNSDPLGLYIDDLLIMGYDIAKSASALIGNYAFDMSMDVDWALDWSAGDYEHSRFAPTSFETVEEGQVAGSGQASYASIVTIIRASGRGFRAIGGLADNVARALYELHHVIPKFLGGLKSGARYGLDPKLHRKFHKELGELSKRVLGQHPNAGDGAVGIGRILDKLDFTKLIEYRQEFYSLMRRFDADNGTALVSVFRREFAQQRMVQGYVRFFK